MRLTRLPLTVEEAMRESGLEKFVDDEVVRELLTMNDNDFKKIYSCYLRHAKVVLKIYSELNLEGLSHDDHVRYYHICKRLIQEVDNFRLVNNKRKEYQALLGERFKYP